MVGERLVPVLFNGSSGDKGELGAACFDLLSGDKGALGAVCFDVLSVDEGASGGEFFEGSIGVDGSAGAEERNKCDMSSNPLPSFLPLSIAVNSDLTCLNDPPCRYDDFA